MNVAKVSSQQALSPGAELWVIKNDPSLFWWRELDFASHYLLSQNYFKPHKEVPSQLISIIEATKLNTQAPPDVKNYVLLGSEAHFHNKWTLVWSSSDDFELADALTDLSSKLQIKEIRLFSHSDEIIKKLNTRPSASSLSISFIE